MDGAWEEAPLCLNAAFLMNVAFFGSIRKDIKGTSGSVEASLGKLAKDVKSPLPRLLHLPALPQG